MIDPLTIGAGLTLFALGAGGTWAVMRARVVDAQDNADLWEQSEQTCSKHFDDECAAHSRCADASATKQRILDDLADYLRGQKSGTAVKALRMIEERHL